MAQLAIVFTANGVVRRVTTDAAPLLATDESAIAPAAPINFGAFTGGRVKLDVGNNPVQATLAEWRAAGLDDAFNAAQRQVQITALKADIASARTAVQTMNADATVNANVKAAVVGIGQVLADMLQLMN